MMTEDDDAIDRPNVPALIERMRTDERVPREVLAEIEQAYEIFKVFGALYPAIAYPAYGLGLVIGGYSNAPDAVAETLRLYQSVTAYLRNKKRLNEWPWRDPATRLAQRIRAERPSWSQERLADKILERWQSAEIARPEHSSLVSHIRELERAGELPKKVSRAGAAQRQGRRG
jgi:hypothetical protein